MQINHRLIGMQGRYMPGGVEHDNHDSQFSEAHGRNEYKNIEWERGWLVVDMEVLKYAPALYFATQYVEWHLCQSR
jgi:hypothetical protein